MNAAAALDGGAGSSGTSCCCAYTASATISAYETTKTMHTCKYSSTNIWVCFFQPPRGVFNKSRVPLFYSCNRFAFSNMRI
jgi:hypothetical protein